MTEFAQGARVILHPSAFILGGSGTGRRFSGIIGIIEYMAEAGLEARR